MATITGLEPVGCWLNWSNLRATYSHTKCTTCPVETMTEAMEVDDGAIKQEVVNGSAEDVAVAGDAMALDKVTALQDSVDKMALSMFNALRLLPATLGDDKGKEENVAAIKALAAEVLKTVKETDALIDDLPGLDKTEDEQLEEMRRLQLQSEEEAQTLRQVADEAERWMDRARDSLRVISETRLRR